MTSDTDKKQRNSLKDSKRRTSNRLSWWSRELSFKRDYANGMPSLPDDADPRDYFGLIDEHEALVSQRWRTIQTTILRGLYGGLVASLAVVGSQLFSGPLRYDVAYLTSVFLLGLAVQAARMIIEGFGAIERSLGLSTPVLKRGPGFMPGRGWTTLPLLVDAVSMIILIYSVCYGLNLLFDLAE